MFNTASVSASISASTPSQWPMTRLTLAAGWVSRQTVRMRWYSYMYYRFRKSGWL